VLWQDTNVLEEFAASTFISTVLENVGILPQHCTASQPRRLWFDNSLLWKPQILQH